MNAQAMERAAAAIITQLPREERYQVTQLRLKRGETPGEFVRHALWKSSQGYELTALDYERLADDARQSPPVPEVTMTPQPDGRVYLSLSGRLADEIHAAALRSGVPDAVLLRDAIAEIQK